MSDGAPELIAIDHDDHHAEHIGRLRDGRQFFLTTPFVPGGGEFVALYLFDSDGQFLDATVESFGLRNEMDDASRKACYDSLLSGLDQPSFERIEIRPFSIERHGVTFGLISHPPEDDEEPWSATFEPGNVMAFYEPWDSGDYDT